MPIVSPWTPTGEGAAWDRFQIGNVIFPAAVALDGDLWKPKNDHHRGRGTRGGRSVASGWDLAEFTVTFQAFDDETDLMLSKVLDLVTQRPQQRLNSTTNTADVPPATSSSNASTTTGAPTAFDVKHPALLAAGITQVTFEGADAPKPDGPGGFLVWKVKLKEYRPPTPAPARAVAPATPATAPAFDSGGAAILHEPFGANHRVALPSGNP